MVIVSLFAEPFDYHDADVPLAGVLTGDDAGPPDRPGILLIHGGAGLDDHARSQARRYAELGYLVLAADMFGPGVAGDRDRLVSLLTGLRDEPARLAQRGRAGLTALAGRTGGPLAVIGFCFGGMAALTLARSGAPLAAAVSIHGTLTTTAPAEPGAVRARVLACHGARDPYVPFEHLAAFAAEMDAAGADWQANVYGDAEHGFTHAHAVPGAMAGVTYQAEADERSFADVRALLAATLT